MLESAYEECLAQEMKIRGLNFQRQAPLPVVYKGTALDCGYRLDFVVEKAVVLELKSVGAIEPVHEAQLLTYLKLGGWTLIANASWPYLALSRPRHPWQQDRDAAPLPR